MENQKTVLELQPLLREWASSRNLLNAEIAPKQKLKLFEELGEVSKAILNTDVQEQKDGIGDGFVVLSILAMQIGDFDSLFDGYAKIREQTELLLLDVLDNAVRYNSVANAMASLQIIALKLGYDFQECANIAWNEIKDQKGKTVGGTFIKESVKM